MATKRGPKRALAVKFNEEVTDSIWDIPIKTVSCSSQLTCREVLNNSAVKTFRWDRNTHIFLWLRFVEARWTLNRNFQHFPEYLVYGFVFKLNEK